MSHRNFKSAVSFKDVEFDLTRFGNYLEAQAHEPCGNHTPFNYGWTPPIKQSQLAYPIQTGFLFCFRKQTRNLPQKTVNDALAIKIEEMLSNYKDGYKLSREDIANLKADIVFEMLPCAFLVNSDVMCHYSPTSHRLIIGDGSRKNAEAILGFLSKMDGLIVNQHSKPAIDSLLTERIKGGASLGFDLGTSCVLSGLEKQSVKITNMPLTDNEVQQHISDGKKVTELELSNGVLLFTIRSDCSIKSIKTLDRDDGEKDDEASILMEVREISNLFEEIERDIARSSN